MNLKQKLGKRIQELRKSQNLTQERLAETVNIDITSLSKIETGRNYPQPDTLEKIATALNVDVDKLFIFNTYPNKEEYINAINKNILLMQNDLEKLKILYSVSAGLI